MPLTASVAITSGSRGGMVLTIADSSDVARLVDLLRRPEVSTATIESDAAVVDAHVEHGFGYLLYSGEAAFAYSQGDPASPAVTGSEVGFPAGSGLPLGRFAEALTEFVRTAGGLPACVPWREE